MGVFSSSPAFSPEWQQLRVVRIAICHIICCGVSMVRCSNFHTLDAGKHVRLSFRIHACRKHNDEVLGRVVLASCSISDLVEKWLTPRIGSATLEIRRAKAVARALESGFSLDHQQWPNEFYRIRKVFWERRVVRNDRVQDTNLRGLSITHNVG